MQHAWRQRWWCGTKAEDRSLNMKDFKKKLSQWVTWVAQSVGYATLGLGSGHNLMVLWV